MYCSNCGAKAAGNFCSACGRRLGEVASENKETPPPPPPANDDWENEVDPEKVLAQPEVRELVSRCAANAEKPVAAEEYFKIFDKLAFMPLPSASLVSIALPIYEKLGVKTGKTRTESLRIPPGRVLASLFCLLAKKGRKVLSTERANDGCVVTAELPSDFWTMAGKLVVAVQRLPTGAKVEAATAIPGQYFDYGKSTRCLNELFESLSKQAS